MPNRNSKIETQKIKIEKKLSAKTVVAKKTETNKKVTKTPKKGGLTIDVFDMKGKVTGTMTLPKDIFGAKINNQLMAQAVRVYLANQRTGTASTKTRGQVRGSTRKIWRQKGTGRARHGGIRAPIFVGGGAAHGPKPKDFSLKLSKKMKRFALFSALSAKVKMGRLKVIAGLEKISPKTKNMVDVFNKLQLENKERNIMLVLPDASENIDRASRNITGVESILASNITTYEVLKNNTLLFMRDSIDVLEKRLGGEK